MTTMAESFFVCVYVLMPALCSCTNGLVVFTHSRSASRVSMRGSHSAARRAGKTPWEILDLPPPASDGVGKLLLADVHRAFRKVAKTAHPDVEGGSQEDFQLLVWAYHEVTTKGAAAGKAPSDLKKQRPFQDNFLNDFMKEKVYIPGYGSLVNIEAETDDDGWLGREGLGDFFVQRHDAVKEGAVQEDDLAIYRLTHSINGRFWGVGKVMSVQASFSWRNTAPGGRIFLAPLRMKQACMLDQNSHLEMIADSCAEVVVCRLVDRFELLKSGVKVISAAEGEYTVECGSSSQARLTSNRVHIANCDFEEGCDMKAEECIYCFSDEECALWSEPDLQEGTL